MSHGISIRALLVIPWLDFEYPTQEQLRSRGVNLGVGGDGDHSPSDIIGGVSPHVGLSGLCGQVSGAGGFRQLSPSLRKRLLHRIGATLQVLIDLY